jgi:hypothetical protein
MANTARIARPMRALTAWEKARDLATRPTGVLRPAGIIRHAPQRMKDGPGCRSIRQAAWLSWVDAGEVRCNEARVPWTGNNRSTY